MDPSLQGGVGLYNIKQNMAKNSNQNLSNKNNFTKSKLPTLNPILVIQNLHETDLLRTAARRAAPRSGALFA